MDLEYHGKSRIVHERIHPKAPNSCRLSVCANALNYFHGQTLFTPEQVLDAINLQRETSGQAPVDLDMDFLSDKEIASFVHGHGLGIEQAAVEGRGSVNLALWDELIAKGFLIAPDHQLLYSDPKVLLRNDVFYLPPDLVKKLVFEEVFSYQTFIELYNFFISYAGRLDEGHIDLVLDVRKVNHLDSLILANLASKGNEFPIALPWHFFCNYLAFDWFGPAITDISNLPDEMRMNELFNKGVINYAGRDFFYGSLEVYHQKDRRRLLEAILNKYDLKVVETES